MLNTTSFRNMKKSFENESQALLKYLIYADIAREEGHEEIADLFEKMAQNEREHAKIWYRLMNEGYDSTENNLKNAASGENYEWKKLYPLYASQARKEGLSTVANMFERIASIESDHERRFYEAYNRLTSERETLPSSDRTSGTVFFCLFCGQDADHPLSICPTCGAANSFTA